MAIFLANSLAGGLELTDGMSLGAFAIRFRHEFVENATRKKPFVVIDTYSVRSATAEAVV